MMSDTGEDDYLTGDLNLTDLKSFTHFVRSITFGGELIASITIENSRDLTMYESISFILKLITIHC